ncbi:uncharacterized protein KZ484_012977 [Pholidichthys leucotaenia]
MNRFRKWLYKPKSPTSICCDTGNVWHDTAICYDWQEENDPPQTDLASLFTEMQAEDLLNWDQLERHIQLLLSEAAWLACVTHSNFFFFFFFFFLHCARKRVDQCTAINNDDPIIIWCNELRIRG